MKFLPVEASRHCLSCIRDAFKHIQLRVKLCPRTIIEAIDRDTLVDPVDPASIETFKARVLEREEDLPTFEARLTLIKNNTTRLYGMYTRNLSVSLLKRRVRDLRMHRITAYSRDNLWNSRTDSSPLQVYRSMRYETPKGKIKFRG